jgi:2'-5' RNA ligase
MPSPPAPPAVELHRLFFALWPDEVLRQRIAEASTALLATPAIRGRRSPPRRYHLTLQFLGDFAGLREAPIDAAIAAAGCVQVPAFDLALEQAASFGRVGWLGPACMPEGLLRLWDALAVALAAHGVPFRSVPSLTPHVTVVRNLRQPLPPMPIPPLRWPVDEFVLIHSQPGGTSDYELLGRWPLQGRPAHAPRIGGVEP